MKYSHIGKNSQFLAITRSGPGLHTPVHKARAQNPFKGSRTLVEMLQLYDEEFIGSLAESGGHKLCITVLDMRLSVPGCRTRDKGPSSIGP